MSHGEILPRVLFNPKVHRRSGGEASFSRGSNMNQENKKHLCPPIDAAKDKVSLISENPGFNPLSDKTRLNLNNQPDKCSVDAVISPLSPADGLSPACTAMANACSHDHDYLSPDLIRSNRDGSRHMSELSLNLDLTDETTARPRVDVKTITRIPAPPKITTQKSPRTGIFNREVNLRHHRRIVKPEFPAETVDSNVKQTQHHGTQADDTACVFVSTSKTAQPRSRTSRRKAKVIGNENQPLSKGQPLSSSSNRSTSTTLSESSNDSTSENFSKNVDFDFTKDKLTLEWQNMVKKHGSKKDDPTYSSDNLSDNETCQPVCHSTPDRMGPKTDSNMPSPRPSATPCPPCPSRRSARHRVNSNSSEKCELHEESVVTKNDSAYFSFNSSISSFQPCSSSSTPILRTSARIQSRPSTGQRSAGSTRPPSGGKRGADASLSSTSSGASSDDDSLCSSISSRILDEEGITNECENKIDARTNKNSYDSSKSATGNLRPEHKAVKLKRGKKVVVKPHMRPIPPRKPKEPLPMHRRALPTSFFQEPNKFSPSPYNILPPVLPLFRQPFDDDVKDIRPVTPPEQQRPSDECHCNFSESDKRVVINMGDADLLHRLFDAVDPPQQPAGRRIKRGRPKRTPRILPSPKLTLDNNPCIMQSITEKLFPKLSIEKRQSKQRLRNQVSTMMLASEKNLLEESGISSLNGNLGDYDTHDKDLSQFGLLSFNSTSYEDDSPETRMEISSPTQRQEVLALPQLSLAQDYSQMLSDVAAVL